MHEAEASGVEPDILDEACKVLRQKERLQKAREALQKALLGDIDELRSAIQQGKAAGLPDEELAAALAKLEQMEAEAEAAERRAREEAEAAAEAERIREEERLAMLERAKKDQARDMLERALRSRDIDALRAAIDAGAKVGLDEELIDEAREALKEEEAKEEQLARMQSARNALTAAISSGNIDRLRDALERAAGLLEESELAEARRVLDELEKKASARAGLHEALQFGASLDEINESLRNAEVLTGDDADAADTLLIDEVKKKATQEMAKEVLEAALSSGDAEQIRQALLKAGEAGINANALQDAISTLQTLDRKAEAQETLQKALRNLENVEELRSAIDAAREAGLEVNEAEASLRKAEQRATAQQRLSNALNGSETSKFNVEALRAALEEAKEVEGIEENPALEAMVKEGERRLAQEEERAKLARTLQSLQQTGATGDLQSNKDLTSTRQDLSATQPSQPHDDDGAPSPAAQGSGKLQLMSTEEIGFLIAY